MRIYDGIKKVNFAFFCLVGRFLVFKSYFSPGNNVSNKKGQTVVEYLLMLAAISAFAIILGILFHRRILGGFFTLVGMIIGAGKPT